MFNCTSPGVISGTQNRSRMSKHEGAEVEGQD